GLTGFNCLSDSVKVACTHFALVFHSGKAQGCSGELFFLQLNEGAHLVAGVAVSQFEHAVVQCVETSQGDELELVAHGTELALELGNGGVVQVLLPVERWRAVVGQQLARELTVDGFRKAASVFQIRGGSFAPDQVGVRSVGQTTGNGLIQTGTSAVEAFNRTLVQNEGAIVLVHIAGDQVRCVRIGTGNQNRGNVQNVGSQTSSHQLGDGFTRCHNHGATQETPLLGRSQLDLERNASSDRHNHGFHQFKCVQHATETGFRVGHDRSEVIHVAFVTWV